MVVKKLLLDLVFCLFVCLFCVWGGDVLLLMLFCVCVFFVCLFVWFVLFSVRECSTCVSDDCIFLLSDYTPLDLQLTVLASSIVYAFMLVCNVWSCV